MQKVSLDSPNQHLFFFFFVNQKECDRARKTNFDDLVLKAIMFDLDEERYFFHHPIYLGSDIFTRLHD